VAEPLTLVVERVSSLTTERVRPLLARRNVFAPLKKGQHIRESTIRRRSTEVIKFS
jgi:hypothetical protein